MVATYLLPLLNGHTLPDATGDVYLEPSSVTFGSNDRYNHLLLAFTSQSARRGIAGKFRVPDNYVSGAAVAIRWVTTATSDDCVWDVDYTAIGSGESYDPSADQQSASVTDTAAGTARLLNWATISLTAGNFAPGDEVQFLFVRDAADAADTLAATAYLVGLYFSYSDA
jgi:hypothetical protein